MPLSPPGRGFLGWLLILGPALAAGDRVPSPAVPPPVEHGFDHDLEWVGGSWGELLDRAATERRPVLLAFFDPRSPECRRFRRSTLKEADVARALRDYLAFAVDRGAPGAFDLEERWRVQAPPVLLFLDPAGELVDRLEGTLDPRWLRAEIERIRRGEGTLGALRRAVEERPEDLEARYALAVKLRAIGDEAGARDQVEAIGRLDPEGEHVVSRRLALEDLRVELERTLELQPLYAFLEKESDGGLLYRGWYLVWRYEGHLAGATHWKAEAGHGGRWIRAAHELWSHVPAAKRARVGNEIAWGFYEERGRLSEEEHAFALRVAEAAAAAAPDDPYVLDTLACCAWVAGQHERARGLIERCIALDPENPVWRKRASELR